MKSQTKNNSAILLCGHGSRSNTYYKNLIKIKKIIEQKLCLKVFSCFLEINKPSLEDCLSKNLNKYNKIFIFPFLIFEGKHFKEDVIRILKKYDNDFQNIVFIDKISLLDEILPITLNILEKKVKKGKNTVLVTSSSYSKDSSVLLNLKKYTEALTKKLTISNSFFHYVGQEKEVIKKLKLIENDKLSILLHPIFLFEGFLYTKNTKCFYESFSSKVFATSSLTNENQILQIIIEKLVNRIATTN